MNKPITAAVRKSLVIAIFPLTLLSTTAQAHNYFDLILPSYFWVEHSYHVHNGHTHHRHHRPRHVHNHHFKPYKKHRSKHGRHNIRHHNPRHHGHHHRSEKRIIKKHSR